MKNPQAFPDPMRGAESSFMNQEPWNLSEGMTLRDYFAAKAMQGAYSHSGITLNQIHVDAEAFYAIADAMLKAREQ